MPKIFYNICKVKEKLENTFSQLKKFFRDFKIIDYINFIAILQSESKEIKRQQ